MIFEFLLAFIPVLLSSALATAVSGGSFGGVLDIYDFLAVILTFAILIFLTGYGKVFLRIFSFPSRNRSCPSCNKRLYKCSDCRNSVSKSHFSAIISL
jgi:O-antigen ligase